MSEKKISIIVLTILCLLFIGTFVHEVNRSNERIIAMQEEKKQLRQQPAWREIDRMHDNNGNLIVTYKRNGYVGTSWDMMIFYNKDGSLFKTIMKDANNN